MYHCYSSARCGILRIGGEPFGRNGRRQMTRGRVLLVLAGCFFSTPLYGWAQSAPSKKAANLSPPQVFSQASPSVFVVEACDAKSSVLALGSGVALEPHELVTNK